MCGIAYKFLPRHFRSSPSNGPANENQEKGKLVPGEPFISIVDDIPVTEQLSDSAMIARLDPLRADRVLMPSSDIVQEKPVDPSENMDWKHLVSYSLPNDEYMLLDALSFGRMYPVAAAAAPNLRRTFFCTCSAFRSASRYCHSDKY